MTYFFNQVYIEETATICGPYEKKGPLRRYFDKTYDDLYCGKTSFEKAEIQLVKDVIVMLLKKSGYKKEEIDVVMGGDLSNQITATTYGSLGVGNGFVGIYAACSTSSLGLLLSACLIQGGFVQNSLCMVSSHNLSSERQFRYPIEYGSLRPHTSTFTATGAGACLLSSEKSDVRIDCATLGRVMDYEQTDPNDMGRVMAPGVIDTLKRHLEDTGRNASYYDLIVTGDLGKYGVEIVRDYFQKEYQLSLPNLQDCGVLLYDLE